MNREKIATRRAEYCAKNREKIAVYEAERRARKRILAGAGKNVSLDRKDASETTKKV